MADLLTETSGLAAEASARDKTMETAWQRGCCLVVEWEWLVLLLILPAVLFPSPSRILVLLLLPLLWGARWVVTGRLVPPTPLNGTLLAFLLMVFLSLFATFDLAYSVPKIAGIVYGVSLFYAVVTGVGREKDRFFFATSIFVALGVGLSLFGLLTLRWSSNKLPILAPVIPLIPRRFVSLPGATDGVSPNQLAGMLLWLLPVALALACLVLMPHGPWEGRSWWRRLPFIALSWVAAALFGGIFLLTQSRSALLGFLAAVPLVALIPLWRYKLPILGLVVAAGLVALFWLKEPETVLPVLDQPGSLFIANLGDTIFHLEARFTIWTHALAGIRDFPWTGMGVGMFRRVVPQFYPFFSLSMQEDVAHAHNHLLQAALDLGLPGLVTYLALWLGVVGMLRQVWRVTAARWSRWLVLAFTVALLAYFIFGLTDTVALGAKTGFLFWFLLGLIAAFHRTIVPVIGE